MGLEGVREKKLLYHLTKVSNMETIIRYGMLPRRYLLEHGMLFEDVAVKSKYAAEKFVYICIKRALAEFNDFKVLIKHPLSQQDCVLYDYAAGINNIDWDIMESVGTTDEYARNVKMAECLTEKCIPADLFQCVYVPDMETKQYVEKLFQDKGITEQPPYVNLQPKWF